MIDVISSVSSAIQLASRLREESQGLENSEIRTLAANLSDELDAVRQSIAAILSARPGEDHYPQAGTGVACETCPHCGWRTLGLVACRPHPLYGDIGGTDRELRCSACGFTESRYVDV